MRKELLVLNFSKHRVSERAMLSRLMDYTHKIITHRRKQDDRYLTVSVCISSKSNGVEITHNNETIMVVKYDERNDFYYFLEKVTINSRTLSNRVVIEDKDDFYAYFDYVVKQELDSYYFNKEEYTK